MSLFQNQPVSRRSAIAGLLGTAALLRTGSVGSAPVDRPAPIDLGHGLEIRDYRLFPTDDVMRFIVEIHNTTDTAVDTPTVGVVLPHFDEGNFGWANPVSPVLHPHASDCLIGVAPDALASNMDWSIPEWAICGEIETAYAERLDDVDIEYSYTLDFRSSTHLHIPVEFTNHSHVVARNVVIQGIVRDIDDRLCGATMPLRLADVAPGQSAQNAFNIAADREYHANPFVLIDTVAGIGFDFKTQPSPPIVNNGCSLLMPR